MNELDLEAALDGVPFRKSDECLDKSCVEVAVTADAVGVRDSKNGSILRFTAGEWSAFLAGAKKGEFDLPA